MPKFAEFLKELGSVSSSELKNLLHIFPVNNLDPDIRCEFYLMRCEERDIREDDFIEFLCENLVNFTMSYAETQPPAEIYTKEELHKYYRKIAARMVSKSRSYFIKKNEQTGELGELFLFIVLESKGIIQLLNKMNLKTSPEMPVHGWDAIHIGVEENKRIVLHYGYSKMHQGFSEGLTSAIDEVNDFSKNKNREKYELNLVSSHLDTEKFNTYSEAIKNLLSPYARNKQNLRKAQSIFIGYEWVELKNPIPPKACNLEDHLISKYKATHEERAAKIKQHIQSLPNASKYTFFVCALPFADLKEIRSKFRRKIKSTI
jgi:hypothetical protein